MKVGRAARFLIGKCAGLVCCKTGGGAGCFPFVGGARTIIFSIKLRWRNRVDLNRDHRFSRDTEMPTSDISFQKNNNAVARLAVYIG